jgi:hypothetical protein
MSSHYCCDRCRTPGEIHVDGRPVGYHNIATCNDGRSRDVWIGPGTGERRAIARVGVAHGDAFVCGIAVKREFLEFTPSPMCVHANLMFTVEEKLDVL